MPFTLPAHAAAVLPLCKLAPRWLHRTALVVGTCAPDLVYLAGFTGFHSHGLAGLVTLCVPLGIFGVLWAEELVLPWLAAITPTMLGIAWPRVLQPAGLPRTRRELVSLLLSLLLGAGSHDLWDGFTHATLWPASALYGRARLELFGTSYALCALLWYASSILGTAIVVLHLLRRFAAPVRLREGRPWLFVGTVACTSLGVAMAVLLRLALSRHPACAWQCYTAGATGALVALSGVCLAPRLRKLHARQGRPQSRTSSDTGGP